MLKITVPVTVTLRVPATGGVGGRNHARVGVDVQPAEAGAGRVKRVGHRFSRAFIGTTGLEVDPKGRLLFGHHSDSERETKEAIFSLPCRHRFIALTQQKVGNAGAKTIDLLRDVDMSPGRISIVSELPPKDSPADIQLNRALDALLSGKVRERLISRQVELDWYVIDCHTGEEKRHIPVTTPDAMDSLREQIDAIRSGAEWGPDERDETKGSGSKDRRRF